MFTLLYHHSHLSVHFLSISPYVDTRLKLAYGEQFGVSISSIIDVGTKVVMKIPRISVGVSHRELLLNNIDNRAKSDTTQAKREAK